MPYGIDSAVWRRLPPDDREAIAAESNAQPSAPGASVPVAPVPASPAPPPNLSGASSRGDTPTQPSKFPVVTAVATAKPAPKKPPVKNASRPSAQAKPTGPEATWTLASREAELGRILAVSDAAARDVPPARVTAQRHPKLHPTAAPLQAKTKPAERNKPQPVTLTKPAPRPNGPQRTLAKVAPQAPGTKKPTPRVKLQSEHHPQMQHKAANRTQGDASGDALHHQTRDAAPASARQDQHQEVRNEPRHGDSKTKASVRRFVDVPLSLHELQKLRDSSHDKRAVANIRTARRSWNLLVEPVVDKYGQTSPEALKAKLSWEQINSRRMPVTQVLQAVGESGRAEAGFASVAARIVKGAGKVGGPLGVVSGAAELISPSEGGWKGVVDRVGGGVSVAGGATEALIALQLITVPGLGEAVLIVGAGFAIWSLANLAVDERHAIVNAIKTSGTAIARTAEETARVVQARPALFFGPAREIAKLAWDHHTSIGAVAADGIRAGEHITGDMIDGFKAGAEELASGAEDVGKAIATSIGWLTGG